MHHTTANTLINFPSTIHSTALTPKSNSHHLSKLPTPNCTTLFSPFCPSCHPVTTSCHHLQGSTLNLFEINLTKPCTITLLHPHIHQPLHIHSPSTAYYQPLITTLFPTFTVIYTLAIPVINTASPNSPIQSHPHLPPPLWP